MSYYAWTGAPLYEWSRPIGNDAGAYEFLIGGVVIPLVTSQTIKGKVTFLEKFGTGAPNTTGAYELDIAELNNFTGAWRPMHVKTDIFCSASLTLPDKAGRQINVGGWANDATYGIRLYTPDGEPGVWGVNDWQENVDEVSLQNGRWYPSAMIMVSLVLPILCNDPSLTPSYSQTARSSSLVAKKAPTVLPFLPLKCCLLPVPFSTATGSTAPILTIYTHSSPFCPLEASS
jgi:hypothetical protein